jgi:hypothetical protein
VAPPGIVCVNGSRYWNNHLVCRNGVFVLETAHILTTTESLSGPLKLEAPLTLTNAHLFVSGGLEMGALQTLTIGSTSYVHVGGSFVTFASSTLKVVLANGQSSLGITIDNCAEIHGTLTVDSTAVSSYFPPVTVTLLYKCLNLNSRFDLIDFIDNTGRNVCHDKFYETNRMRLVIDEISCISHHSSPVAIAESLSIISPLAMLLAFSGIKFL